jgi:hypothetical protein
LGIQQTTVAAMAPPDDPDIAAIGRSPLSSTWHAPSWYVIKCPDPVRERASLFTVGVIDALVTITEAIYGETK